MCKCFTIKHIISGTLRFPFLCLHSNQHTLRTSENKKKFFSNPFLTWEEQIYLMALILSGVTRYGKKGCFEDIIIIFKTGVLSTRLPIRFN